MAKDDKAPVEPPKAEEPKKNEKPIEVKQVEQPKENETVTMSKDDYKSLLDRVSNLERGVVSDHVIDAPEEHFVYIREFDGKYVTDHGKVTSRMNDKLEEEQYITLELTSKDGKREAIEVKYLDFVQRFDKLKVKLKERKVQNQVTRQGLIDRKMVEGHRTVGTGHKVSAKVVTPIETFVVELPEGGTLELKDKAIN